MAIKTLYVSKVGRDYKISPHFSLGEFQSKDGADKVLYSTELLALLETTREYLGGDAAKVTVHLNSAYRTPAHNKKVGGAANSAHTKGYAVDAVFKRDGKVIPADLMCCLCQSLGFDGVAYISETALHLDEYGRTYRGDERNGYRGNVGGDFYKYFGYSKDDIEELRYVAPEEPEEIVEEEEMTQNQFNQLMNNWISEQAAKEPSAWSEEDRKWAEANGIIKGTGAGMSYLSYCTREQMVAFLHRLFELLK